MATIAEINAEIARRERLAEIDSLIAKKQTEETPKEFLRVGQSATPVEEDFIPTTENLARQPVARPEQSFRDKAVGVGEAALTTATGMTGGALGFIGGSIEGIGKNLLGDLSQEEALKLAQQRAEGLTYAPKGEAGQRYVKSIGEVVGTLPPVLGTTPLTTLKAVTPRINKTADTLLHKTTPAIKKSFSRKTREDRFTPRIFGMVKEARKQGFDDSVTALIANASPTDRRLMHQQVRIVEAGKGNARVKALSRAADVAGGALVKKVNYVQGENKSAGVQLGRVAESLKGKPIDIEQPIASFVTTLKDKLGVSFNEKFEPLFKGSELEAFPESRKVVEDIAKRIQRNPSSDAFEAHRFKRLIDKFVSYGKAEGKLDNDLERAAKGLRKNINDVLVRDSLAYKEANNRFAETIKALNSLEDVAGRKLDFKGVNADKAAGVLLRSQTNNTKGRANLLTAIQELEDVAKKFGGSFDDDVLNLSIFADELDAVFGSGARTSLRGEVRKANIDTAVDLSNMSFIGAVGTGVKAGAKYARGINEKNQLKAIKKLLLVK